jgi:hypothetical protein
MSRTEIESLFESIVQPLSDVMEMAGRLSNEDLDARVPGYGGRETPIRNVLYVMANHTGEHVVHLNKIADEIGKGHPSEAQRIVTAAAEAVGALRGALARFDDADLDTTDHESQSVRLVLGHVADGMSTNAGRAGGYLKDGASST